MGLLSSTGCFHVTNYALYNTKYPFGSDFERAKSAS